MAIWSGIWNPSGYVVVFAGDIRTTGQDAFALNHYSGADAVITNPPLSRRTRKPYDCELLHDLIEHFLDIAPTTPTWLLIHYGWSATRQAAKYLPHCSDIVVLPRVKWIEGSKHTGKDDHAWYRFDSRHRCGPVFHNNRGQGEAILTAHQGLRSMRQALRTAAIEFAVLLRNVSAARPSQEA